MEAVEGSEAIGKIRGVAAEEDVAVDADVGEATSDRSPNVERIHYPVLGQFAGRKDASKAIRNVVSWAECESSTSSCGYPTLTPWRPANKHRLLTRSINLVAHKYSRRHNHIAIWTYTRGSYTAASHTLQHAIG